MPEYLAAAPARGGGGPGEDGVSGSRRPFPRVPRKKAFGEQLGNWPSWSGLREACGAGSEVTTFQNGGHMVDLRIGWQIADHHPNMDLSGAFMKLKLTPVANSDLLIGSLKVTQVFQPYRIRLRWYNVL